MAARSSTWLAAALLAACSSVPEAPAPPGADAPRVAPRRAPPPEVRPSGWPAFVERQRSIAEVAAQQGRWPDALWAWEVVLALHPDDPGALAGRAGAQAAVSQGVAERRPRAQAARQRGDWDAAQRLNLEILAMAPDDDAAADALREIERQRTRRGNVAGFRATPAPPAPAPQPQRNDLEHANLLANQGELDAAITLLKPIATAPGASSAARSSLAELYWRQADRLQAQGDHAGVQVALQRCVQLAPTWKEARRRLAEVAATANAASAPVQR